MASRRSWVRIPSAPPTLNSTTYNKFQGALSHFRSQHRVHHFAVRFRFACVRSSALDVHRGANVGVAHEFLLHFHRGSGFIQERRRMTATTICRSRNNWVIRGADRSRECCRWTFRNNSGSSRIRSRIEAAASRQAAYNCPASSGEAVLRKHFGQALAVLGAGTRLEVSCRGNGSKRGFLIRGILPGKSFQLGFCRRFQLV